MNQLHGIIPPLVTPMHADGSLNLGAVPPLVEFVLSSGVHAVFSPGSQGEAFALTADERCRVLEAVLTAVNGRVPVIAGTGAITTHEAIALSRAAQQAGADAVAALTPYFITPSQQELYTYYAEIADAISIPLLGYSNPSRTNNVRVAPETLARLAHDIPHFVGVKDSGSNLAETAMTLRLCPPDFRVFIGVDSLIFAGLCLGAAGAVGLTVNAIPGILVQLYEAVQAGDLARARELQARAAIFREGITQFGSYPAPIKAALELLGVPVGPPRRPILPSTENDRAGLRALLESIGVAV